MNLYFFNSDEFKEWWTQMSPRLLVLLDTLRFQWGYPIRISDAPGAIGRKMGASASQHNVEKWREVRAVDVIPGGVVDVQDVDSFVSAAIAVGFTGIGFYPHWASGFGFHLDVREDREPGYPATWGGVKNNVGNQTYVSLSEAMDRVA